MSDELKEIRIAEQLEPLQAEVRGLREKLAAANRIVEAIQRGDVDALVIDDVDGQRAVMITEAEQPYRIMVEQMREGAVTTTIDGAILYSNPHFAHLVGLPPNHLAGVSLRQFLAPEDRPALASFFAQAMERGETRQFTLLARDGDTMPVLIAASPFEFDQEQSLCLVVTDLTDQKMHEHLRESEQRLRLALSSAQAGTWDWSLATGELICSPETCALFGLTEDQPMHITDWLGVVHADDRTRVAEELRRVLNRRLTDHQWEFQIQHPHKGIRWLVSLGRVTTGERGEPVRMYGISLDITDRKRAELALEHLNRTLEQRVLERTAELQERNRQILRLASELNEAEQRERRRLAELLHDHLQQYLTAALFRSEKLRAQISDNTSREDVEKLCGFISEAARASRTLTAQLRPAVLYEDGLGPALHWLGDWIHETHQFKVEVRTSHGIELEDHVARTLAFESARELLLNAVKHSGADGAVVHLARQGREVVVEVRDEGRGFDPAEAIARRTTRTSGGFGLFSLEERLEIIGGRIEIDSAPDEGAVIRLFVPGRSVAPGTPAGSGPAGAVGSSRREEPPVVTVRRPGPGRSPAISVLIVDDYQLVRDGIAHLLEEAADIKVIGEAGNGRQAVEAVRELRPNIVLMDVRMPVMDGIEATRRIRSEFGEVRIVGLTADARSLVADAMRRAGADAVLAKHTASKDSLVRLCRSIMPDPAPVPVPVPVDAD